MSLLRRDDGRPTVLGWVLAVLLTLVLPMMIVSALNLPDWPDITLSIAWILGGSVLARRYLGIRF